MSNSIQSTSEGASEKFRFSSAAKDRLLELLSLSEIQNPVVMISADFGSFPADLAVHNSLLSGQSEEVLESGIREHVGSIRNVQTPKLELSIEDAFDFSSDEIINIDGISINMIAMHHTETIILDYSAGVFRLMDGNGSDILEKWMKDNNESIHQSLPTSHRGSGIDE